MEDQGWIKLWRKTMDNPRMGDPYFVAVWVHILLLATHKKLDFIFDGKRITLQPGQFVTGRNWLSKKSGVERSKVERVLRTMESEQQIEQQTTNKNRLITVLNWKDYQESEQQIEQQVSNKRATSEQQVSTKQEHKNIRMKEDIITTTEVVEAAEPPVVHGNEEINSVMQSFKSHFGFDSQGRGKFDRFCAKHLLNNFTAEQIAAMMVYCNSSQFAPRVGSVEKLWYKRGDIIAGIKKERSENTKPKIFKA